MGRIAPAGISAPASTAGAGKLAPYPLETQLVSVPAMSNRTTDHWEAAVYPCSERYPAIQPLPKIDALYAMLH